jgi:phosphoenolpyruvate carboxylase
MMVLEARINDAPIDKSLFAYHSESDFLEDLELIHHSLCGHGDEKVANADIIDLRDLLVGYNATSNLSDFVTATAEASC